MTTHSYSHFPPLWRAKDVQVYVKRACVMHSSTYQAGIGRSVISSEGERCEISV